MQKIRKIGIDTRELSYPEPSKIATKILETLDENTYFYMINHKNLIPLIKRAKEKAFQTISYQNSKKEWHILISKNPEIVLENFLKI